MESVPEQRQSPGGGDRPGAAVRLRLQAANAITLLRVLVTPAFAVAVWRAHVAGPSAWPLSLFALVAGSDLADGPVARRLATASESGRILDHLADIAFLLTGLTVYAWLSIVPWWVPASIGASFLFYVADSWRRGAGRAAPRLIGSRLGHAAGVLNYALVGVVAGNDSLGLHWLSSSLMSTLFLLVPIYSAAAVALRILPARDPKGGLPPPSDEGASPPGRAAGEESGRDIL